MSWNASIAGLWRDVLGVDQVGAHDNFFDLGGHSLLLAEVQDEAGRATLRDELSMVDMFQHPTVGALAEYLSLSESGPGDERAARMPAPQLQAPGAEPASGAAAARRKQAPAKR